VIVFGVAIAMSLMGALTSLMRGTRFVHDPARVNDPATPVTNVAQGLLRGRERCLNSQVGPPAAPRRGLARRAAGWYCFSSGTRKSAVARDWGVL
jgi:hypothetical protein